MSVKADCPVRAVDESELIEIEEPMTADTPPEPTAEAA